MLEVGTGFNREMTGRENIYMNGAILGMTKAEIDAKMEDIIEFSEVRDFIDTPVKRYSSGMYVKLAFSVAAHLDSEIMIMDEVLAVGDMAFQKKCLDKMREAANKEGRTVLYVSHNMNTIRQLCDRCIVLDRGKIIFDGDVEDAIEVYMGVSVELKKHYEYTPEFHTEKGSKAVYLKSTDIQNCEFNTFSIGDPIDLLVKCEIRAKCENVKIRLEIQYADSTVAATAFSKQGIDFLEEKTEIIRIIFDTSHLAPGRYKADMVAYCTDPFGNDIYLDGVIPAMHFEIAVGNKADEASSWPHKYWGHIRLHDMQILPNEGKNM